MSVVLKTINLTKKYKDLIAVNNLNMVINKGDIYGFIGENGAGKSTVIRLITGLANPTSGKVEVSLEERLGIMQAIVETPAIHLSMSALDNLIYQSKMLGFLKTKEELQKSLVDVGLEDVVSSKKKAKDFSLGMKQRLSIALALLSDPEFILLDEPMNGLDPIGIKKMRDLIISLNKEKGITFLISSHILPELDKVATKYGFISKGKLLKEITADEIHKSDKSIEDYYLEIVGGISNV